METYKKKYKEALEWMRSLYDGLHGATKEDAEHYFPELKKSEDERIRKELIKGFQHYDKECKWGEFTTTEIIAWLEKQGEQKPTDLRTWKYIVADVLTAKNGIGQYLDDPWTTGVAERLQERFGNIKQKSVDVKPHIPDGSIAYDKEYEEAQKYLSERGFDVPWNDGDVFVDERYITQTVANVLAWGDEHPKQKIEKQGGEQNLTLPKWKYKKDHTPLMKDSIILNKYGCVAKSPSGALVSNVWVIDYAELAKLPKEEIEKQGEQILANSAKTCKAEPKFKMGDIMRTLQEAADNITSGLPIIVSSDEEYYHCTNELIAIKDQDDYEYPPMNRIQKPAWTIQDAKDGDVVVDKSDGTVGIFKSIGHLTDGGSYNDPSYCFLHCRYDGYFYADFEDGNTIDSDDVKPATKEQRDLLFQKMKESGYEWNAEKKELKKIEQNNSEESNVGNFDIAGLCYAKAILEKTLGKVEGYQSDDGILEHKSAINAVTKLCDKISVTVDDL